MKTTTITIVILFALALGACSPAPGPQTYDLVILNGRVMDPETEYDQIANVGVKDGKISVIAKDKLTGKETIDATGHVVAPGFIDTHFHALEGCRSGYAP